MASRSVDWMSRPTAGEDTPPKPGDDADEDEDDDADADCQCQGSILPGGTAGSGRGAGLALLLGLLLILLRDRSPGKPRATVSRTRRESSAWPRASPTSDSSLAS